MTYSASPSFSPVGQCIYCGSTNSLTKEHILPLGLGGNWILPKASCTDCARITGAFEQFCLRPMLGRLRIRLKLPTRRPNERPDELPFDFFDPDGIRRKDTVPVDQMPITCFGFRFPAPGLLRGVVPNESFEGEMVAKLIGSDMKEHLTSERVKIHLGAINVLAFARMLAKIGHSYAVAHLGLGTFEPLLSPVILGTSPFASHLVGGDVSVPTPEAEPTLHHVYLQNCTSNGTEYVLVAIRLFALFGMPRYHVVVGRSTAV